MGALGRLGVAACARTGLVLLPAHDARQPPTATSSSGSSRGWLGPCILASLFGWRDAATELHYRTWAAGTYACWYGVCWSALGITEVLAFAVMCARMAQAAAATRALSAPPQAAAAAAIALFGGLLPLAHGVVMCRAALLVWGGRLRLSSCKTVTLMDVAAAVAFLLMCRSEVVRGVYAALTGGGDSALPRLLSPHFAALCAWNALRIGLACFQPPCLLAHAVAGSASLVGFRACLPRGWWDAPRTGLLWWAELGGSMVAGIAYVAVAEGCQRRSFLLRLRATSGAGPGPRHDAQGRGTRDAALAQRVGQRGAAAAAGRASGHDH
jgi:hypothetical protein